MHGTKPSSLVKVNQNINVDVVSTVMFYVLFVMFSSIFTVIKWVFVVLYLFLCYIIVLCRVLYQSSFAGVLNPEKLSLVKKNFKKSNETMFPFIKEKEPMRSYFGSNSSLGKEDPALHCLEGKLFT